MAEVGAVAVSGAVEGLLDEAVLRRLVEHVGATASSVYGKTGKQRLLQRLNGYNNAAQRGPWFVLVDLNGDDDCAPPFREKWLPTPAPYMCFRIAVREVEAWLFADPKRLAPFLGVRASALPNDPELVVEPKRTMVQVAAISRRRAIREDMVPRPESGRQVGPAYTARLIEFVTNPATGWRPSVAARESDSLERCLRCLRSLVEKAAPS